MNTGYSMLWLYLDSPTLSGKDAVAEPTFSIENYVFRDAAFITSSKINTSNYQRVLQF
jgi:hypothetical protein